ncbi:MAG: restriction endonuclease [Anaerolineaceae bacterium]|nr:restriction endonuclease [Anaerolineaceae bacterium]
MNTTFHYPPELFSLLVDTIPLLCRSKQDVLLFFQGAGVKKEVLNDLWDRIDTDPNNINKYEIARITLTRINELGDATLAERREILRRVTEFEDFSICWPNDQYKAKGLVYDIRQVVNVKDSFTRMNIEREKESKIHQTEQNEKIRKIQQKKANIEKIKHDLYSLFSIPEDQSQKRGKSLEGVLNRLFNANDILVREAFELVGNAGEGIIEQIDGAIEIDGYIYLVEMKWWKSPLGVQEVSQHLVRIFSRSHAGGIIISKSGFTDPAITTCKEALAKKIIVLCELEELVNLLEREGSLKDLLKAKINVAVMEKKPLHKPSI